MLETSHWSNNKQSTQSWPQFSDLLFVKHEENRISGWAERIGHQLACCNNIGAVSTCKAGWALYVGMSLFDPKTFTFWRSLFNIFRSQEIGCFHIEKQKDLVAYWEPLYRYKRNCPDRDLVSTWLMSMQIADLVNNYVYVCLCPTCITGYYWTELYQKVKSWGRMYQDEMVIHISTMRRW